MNPCVRTGVTARYQSPTAMPYPTLTGDLFYSHELGFYLRGIPKLCLERPTHTAPEIIVRCAAGYDQYPPNIALRTGTDYYDSGTIEIVSCIPSFRNFIEHWYPEIHHLLPEP